MLSSIVACCEIVVVIGGVAGGIVDGGGIAQLPVKMESGERTHYDDIILPLLSSNGRYPPYDLRDFVMRHIMRRTTLFIGRHTKIIERGHFSFPDRRHLLRNVSRNVAFRVRACVRAWPPVAATRKLNEDTGFAFPDRRHSSFSEVYPGVEISPLDFLSTITPCSQKCIQSLPARLVAGNYFQVELHCLTIPPNRYSMNRNR